MSLTFNLNKFTRKYFSCLSFNCCQWLIQDGNNTLSIFLLPHGFHSNTQNTLRFCCCSSSPSLPYQMNQPNTPSISIQKKKANHSKQSPRDYCNLSSFTAIRTILKHPLRLYPLLWNNQRNREEANLLWSVDGRKRMSAIPSIPLSRRVNQPNTPEDHWCCRFTYPIRSNCFLSLILATGEERWQQEAATASKPSPSPSFFNPTSHLPSIFDDRLIQSPPNHRHG